MDVSIVGITSQDRAQVEELAVRDKILLAGSHDASICYSGRHYFDIVEEDAEKSRSRLEGTLVHGHHSVHEHTAISLYLRDLPKILAMFLNNEKVYVTSEKSARYTKMKPSAEEKLLYDKWMDVFVGRIGDVYPFIDDAKRKKLAQENARYLTSVFTPTSMKHTLYFRQLNYIMHMFRDFVYNAEDSPFNVRVKPFLDDFNAQLAHLFVDKLDPSMKRRRLSLIADRPRFAEEFGENYCTTYSLSFACLGQAHRHRTLHYQIQPPGFPDDFFVPPILDGPSAEVWTHDLLSVRENFPQASLLRVTEQGSYRDFISKMNERLCSLAQLEIMRSTKSTLERYLAATEGKNSDVHGELLQYAHGPKCTFPGFKCAEPCQFGKKALERLI